MGMVKQQHLLRTIFTILVSLSLKQFQIPAGENSNKIITKNKIKVSTYQ